MRECSLVPVPDPHEVAPRVTGCRLKLRFWFLLVLVLPGSIAGASAAQMQPENRVTEPVNNRVRITLHGNISPLARPQFDRGAVARSFQADHMVLLLRRSAAQERSLRQFLEQVNIPGSADYHHWLTPAQFGRLYGPSDADIAAVTQWLRQQGFSVLTVTPGRNAIEFSGDAGQVRQAFHTAIHAYSADGRSFYANNRDPQIPAALAPVVAGIMPMTNIRPQPNSIVPGKAIFNPKTHAATPQWTFGSPLPLFLLAPGDFAVEYDLNPVYQAGLTGSGVTIGIISDSNIDPAVVANYRALFSLSAEPVHVIVDGNDPGQNGDEVESYLDVELAGSVAPAATIDLYTAADTTVQSGLALAALRAVDEDAASILSVSYGECEQDLGAAGNAFWASLWEQAAAQGQTVLVSAGDGGAAGCDNFNVESAATKGLAVNGIGSTPWNVSVGGTDFYYSSYNQSRSAQTTELDSYWNQTPSLDPIVSLLKPVPEQPWNEAFGLNLATGGKYNPSMAAASGGASSCTAGVSAADGTFSSCSGGYAKPSWQAGEGVPADKSRDLPDVSLFASAGANGSGYPFCFTSQVCVNQNGSMRVGVAGGTSTSTPSMAGILALIDQQYGRQGQADDILYPLAAQHPAVFHDIAVGSNVVPCQPGSPDCTQSTMSDNTSGIYTLGHYYAGTGYDEATGLGTVDAKLLLQEWDSIRRAATSTALTLSQTSFMHGTPVTASVAVSGSGGTPTGDVALVTTATPAENDGLARLTLANGAASDSLDDLPGGKYIIQARYGGDGLHAASESKGVSVDVSPEPSRLALTAKTYSYGASSWQPFAGGGTLPYGTFIAFDGNPAGADRTSGTPTGTVTFTDAGSPATAPSGGVPVNREGTAEWSPTTGFAVGTHSVSASYSGDPSYSASSSTAPIVFTVTKITPGSGLAASAPRVGLGEPARFRATIGLNAGEAAAPTGTVSFFFGGRTLATLPLAPYPGSPGAHVTLGVNSLPLGSDTVTAEYSGDSNYNPVSTPPATVIVMQSAGLSELAAPARLNQMQSFTVTASVPGAAGQPAPTGVIGFEALDSQSDSIDESAAIANGSASETFSGQSLKPGPVTISVDYSGDANYAPALATATVQLDQPFTISADSLNVIAGATTGNTSPITVTPADGFTGIVSLGCSLTGSPADAQLPPACSITPSVNVSGAAAATGTFTVQTTGNTSAAMTRRPGGQWLLPEGGGVLALVLFCGVPKRRRWRKLLGSGLAMLLLAGLSACGSSSGTKTATVQGTTPGTYTFMISAGTPIPSGGNWATTRNISVTVQ